MSDSHPTISIFSETPNNTFPLLLIIGREPNTSQLIENTIGSYDFRVYPRCGFWNTSYSTVANVIEMNTKSFKQLCVQQSSSPIVYADALPTGIPTYIRNKTERRKLLSEEEINEHINNIFSYVSIISRVKLLLLSGLCNQIFKESNHTIKQKCAEQNIPCIDFPFFYGTNTSAIRQALNNQHRSIIKNIVEQFREATIY